MNYLPNDILLLVISSLENNILENISKTYLWNLIVPIIQSQNFWKLRVEYLIRRETSLRDSIELHQSSIISSSSEEDWKEAWYILQERYNSISILTDISSALAIEILILLGFDPSEKYNVLFRTAVRGGNLDVVTLLLRDKRVDPSDVTNDAIQLSSYNGYLEIVRLLLQDSRVDPTSCDNYSLRSAVNQGHEDVAVLLLQDPRVDPHSHDDFVLRTARSRGYTKVLRQLDES